MVQTSVRYQSGMSPFDGLPIRLDYLEFPPQKHAHQRKCRIVEQKWGTVETRKRDQPPVTPSPRYSKEAFIYPNRQAKSMTAPPLSLPKTYLQQATGCLGVCRHCSAMISCEQPYHANLSDVVLALEIAVLLLRDNHRLALDRLRYCANVCNAATTCLKECLHPRYRQSADACRAFLAFWQREELRLTA